MKKIEIKTKFEEIQEYVNTKQSRRNKRKKRKKVTIMK